MKTTQNTAAQQQSIIYRSLAACKNRLDLFETAHSIMNYSVSDGIKFCIAAKLTPEEIINVFTVNKNPSCAQAYQILYNRLIESDNLELQRKMPDLNTERRLWTEYRDDLPEVAKYYKDRGREINHPEQPPPYSERERLISPPGISLSDSSYLRRMTLNCGVNNTLVLNTAIFHAIVGTDLSLIHYPPKESDNSKLNLLIPKINSIRFDSLQASKEFLLQNQIVNPDEVDKVLNKAAEISKLMMKKRLKTIRESVIAGINYKLSELGYGYSFDQNGEYRGTFQKDPGNKPVSLCFKSEVVIEKKIDSIKFIGETLLIKDCSGAFLMLKPGGKLEPAIEEIRFSATTTLFGSPTSSLTREDIAKYKRDPSGAGIYIVKNKITGRASKIRLKQVFSYNNIRYDTSSGNLYITKDGINLKKIYTPFKKGSWYPKYSEYITYQDQLVYPTSKGIGIGRRNIKLPTTIPVTRCIAAKRILDEDVIIIQSNKDIFQVNIKEDKVSKIIKLNGKPVTLVINSGVWFEEGNLERSPAIQADFMGGACHFQHERVTFRNLSSRPFRSFGIFPLDSATTATAQRFESESGNLIAFYEIDNKFTLYAKEKLEDESSTAVGSMLKSLQIDIKRMLNTFDFVCKVQKDNTLKESQFNDVIRFTDIFISPVDFVMPKNLNFLFSKAQEALRSESAEKFVERHKDEDIDNLVSYIENSVSGNLFSRLKIKRLQISDSSGLEPNSKKSYCNSNVTSMEQLISKKGMKVVPGHNGILSSSYMVLQSSSFSTIPIEISGIPEKEITFHGVAKSSERVEIKIPCNSRLIEVKVNDRTIPLESIHDLELALEKGDSFSYTVTKFKENSNVNENDSISNAHKKLPLPKDARLVKIVENALKIPNLGERLKYIKKEYAKISRYRINSKTAFSTDFAERFRDMKKGNNYCGVCADHAVLGYALLSNAGFDALIVQGISSAGRKVMVSPGHACNAVVIKTEQQTSVIEVDFTPPLFRLSDLKDLLGKFKREAPEQELILPEDKTETPVVQNRPDEIPVITEETVSINKDPKELIENFLHEAIPLSLVVNTFALKLFSGNTSDESPFLEHARKLNQIVGDFVISLAECGITIKDQNLESLIINTTRGYAKDSSNYNQQELTEGCTKRISALLGLSS